LGSPLRCSISRLPIELCLMGLETLLKAGPQSRHFLLLRMIEAVHLPVTLVLPLRFLAPGVALTRSLLAPGVALAFAFVLAPRQPLTLKCAIRLKLLSFVTALALAILHLSIMTTAILDLQEQHINLTLEL